MGERYVVSIGFNVVVLVVHAGDISPAFINMTCGPSPFGQRGGKKFQAGKIVKAECERMKNFNRRDAEV
jgi:hypothetical protein